MTPILRFDLWDRISEPLHLPTTHLNCPIARRFAVAISEREYRSTGNQIRLTLPGRYECLAGLYHARRQLRYRFYEDDTLPAFAGTVSLRFSQ